MIARLVAASLVLAIPGAAQIPLTSGLTVVKAWQVDSAGGDYEGILRIDNADAREVRVTATYQSPGPNDPKVSIDTRMARSTMRDARTYRELWASTDPEVIAGTTSMVWSTALLNELAAKGAVSMTIIPSLARSTGGGLAGLTRVAMSDSVATGTPYTGMLRRAEAGPVPFVVLVNGRLTSLPSIHARGIVVAEGDRIDIDMIVLADPANPIVLSSSTTGGTSGRAIRITYPDPATTQHMEDDLAARRPVEVYDIYFDYNSATMRPPSDSVLHEIATVLARHPDWKLALTGHTDSVGGNGAANKALSERRAAAVKDALVARFGIATGRLTTDGAGGTRPVATNSTLDGRARNRRVELRRL
ncbi:MAG TPA: OmpA family protein [Gemmatimonadaceae bacterium]|jgi:hypothetical protein|nr:OmpA family protein [Gemmatimonadaceae bacterium]